MSTLRAFMRFPVKQTPAFAILLTVALLVPVGALAEPGEHPVELVAGSCAEPGTVVARLAAVGGEVAFSEPPAGMAAVVEALGPSVLRGETSVSLALADVVRGDHAVRVLDAAGTETLACGELSGSPEPVADLQLGLTGADMAGVAWLHDNGDGTFGAAVAVTWESEPAAFAAAGDHVEVAISKSLYVPNPLEIEAGTTVTWVNEDELPHTATATTPDAHFDSDYMALDDRFSYTFDEPGEYPYYCVFHPRMRAVVIVS